LENYRIDLGSTSNSPWNQSAGRVLVPYFVEKSGLSLDNHPGLHTMIICAFSSHIDSIRDNHRYWSSDSKAESRKWRTRRSTHTNNLYHVRRHTVATHPCKDLQHHLPMLERFGVQGTSDDESDCEDIQNPQYNICGMSWLSMEATNWKQTVDKVRILSKYQDGSTKSECQWFISGKISTRRDQYVPGLPLNAYNAEWLDGDPMRRKLVRAAPNYDFSH
ncbi:hypothetical protein GGX14DRAFT_302805, partial [Mycena pura]